MFTNVGVERKILSNTWGVTLILVLISLRMTLLELLSGLPEKRGRLLLLAYVPPILRFRSSISRASS
jgi:hypothetical protein